MRSSSNSLQEETIDNQIKMNDDFLLTEYTALRNEILKRLEFQHQLLSLTLIAVGTFTTIGLKSDSPVFVVLIYPILSFFLAAGWAQNAMRIGHISTYIGDKIEGHFGKSGFQNYKSQKDYISKWGPFKSLSVLSARGIFVGTQLFALGLTVFYLPFSRREIVLFGIDVILLLLTAVLVRRWKR